MSLLAHKINLYTKRIDKYYTESNRKKEKLEQNMLMQKIKNNYSKTNKIVARSFIMPKSTNLSEEIFGGTELEFTTNERKKMINTQTEILYNFGDSELKKTIQKIFDNNYKIEYTDNYSKGNYSVGALGGTLDIVFYKNFFDKYKDEKFSQSELMKYTGCLSDQGSIRSMLIHELGHIHFRKFDLNKWNPTLSKSHNEIWANWTVTRLLKFNSTVAHSRPNLLVGFFILKGSNSEYSNPNKMLMDMLYDQYKITLKPNGYTANQFLMPKIESPYDW